MASGDLFKRTLWHRSPDGGDRKVVVRLARPRRDERRTRVAELTIEGLGAKLDGDGDGTYRAAVRGVDKLQIIALALQLIRQALAPLEHELRWLRVGERDQREFDALDLSAYGDLGIPRTYQAYAGLTTLDGERAVAAFAEARLQDEMLRITARRERLRRGETAEPPGLEERVAESIDAVWRERRLDRLAEFWCDDAINHAAPAGARFGLDALRAYHEAQFAALDTFSDVHLRVVRQLRSGDRVASYVIATGRRKRDLPQYPGATTTFILETVRIDRFTGDRIAEHWSLFDDAGLQRQLDFEAQVLGDLSGG